MDGVRFPRPPAALKVDLTVRRIESDQTVAGEKDRRPSAANRCRHPRRVAGVVLGRGPEDFAGFGLERHDAGLVAADVGDDTPAFDEGRAGRTKESLWHVEALHRVLAPAARALCEIHGVELTLRAERVDDAIGDDRHGARSFVEAEVVS